MATRTYTLQFGSVTQREQVLPQGRFFMLKSTDAPLEIEARRRNGQPAMFTGVEGGFKYTALEGERWYELVLRSAAQQQVEIVISDEAEVDFAGVVTVAGRVDTEEFPSRSVTGSRQLVPGGGSVTRAPNANRRRASLCNPSSNAASFWIQGVGEPGNVGVELQPGTTMEFKTVDGLQITNEGGADQWVSWLDEM